MKLLDKAIFGAVFLLLAACGGSSSGDASNAVSFRLSVIADEIFDADSDINDPNQPAISNNTTSRAQLIAPDAEIRGFVAQTSTGDASSNDNFAFSNDPFDTFRTTLTQGQQIALQLFDYDPANPRAVDLDLYILDTNGTLVSVSFEFDAEVERVTVNETGTYFIVVEAFRGQSNYSLVIGDASQTGPLASNQVNIAAMAAQQVTGMTGRAQTVSKVLRPMGAGAPVHPLGGEQVSIYAPMEVTDLALPMASKGPLSSVFPTQTLGMAASRADHDTEYRHKLALLHHTKMTNTAANDHVIRPYHYPRLMAAPPTDPDLQWNLTAVDWEAALDTVDIAAPGIGRPLIAVLDSGVFASHPKIAPVLVDARDFVPAFLDGDAIAAAQSGAASAEANEEVVINDPNPDECFEFHGTHVSSIAVAPRDGGSVNGVIDGDTMEGVLPFADLMMLKLGYNRSPNCQLIVGDIAGAIRYAAGLSNSSGVLAPRRADVINLSFGGTEVDAAVEAAIEAATAEGVIIVASAGNSGAGINPLPEYPASYPDVFAVAATNINDQRAFYSSSYPQVEIAAPGGDARFDQNTDGNSDGIMGSMASVNGTSTGFEADYALYQGSSMAAPHVAAGFALMKAIDPTLDPGTLRRVLEDGLLTEDIAAPGRDEETGFGLMSLKKMVDTAISLRDGTLILAPDFRLEPTAMDLGRGLFEATFSIRRSGGPDFSIASVSVVSSPALTPEVLPDPEPVNVDADGYGTYRLVVFRGGLTPGDYGFEVRVAASNGLLKSIPVSFSVVERNGNAATAPVHVLVQRRTANANFITELSSTIELGAGGSLSGSNLPAGDYRIIFSTDLDNDGETCDPGELGGTLPGGLCESTDVLSLSGRQGTTELVLERQ
ncbi:MAG: S8 family serine peptidase [Pseudomonadota bacterium]